MTHSFPTRRSSDLTSDDGADARNVCQTIRIVRTPASVRLAECPAPDIGEDRLRPICNVRRKGSAQKRISGVVPKLPLSIRAGYYTPDRKSTRLNSSH